MAIVIPVMAVAPVGRVAADTSMAEFAVTRDGAQIGIDRISVERNGAQTIVQTVTHVEVKILFMTVYRFDQTENEKWANGRLLMMRASTDDNGKLYETSANNSGDDIVVEAEGRQRKIAAGIVPISLWNPAVLRQTSVLDPLHGSVVPVKIVNRGDDTLIIQGKPVRTRHYVITTTFSQDVWYDESQRLVRMELKARDGSKICYESV